MTWLTRLRSSWLLPSVLSTIAGAVDVIGFLDDAIAFAKVAAVSLERELTQG